MDEIAPGGTRSPARGGKERPAAALRRGAPLVPTDSAAGRALGAVIAILTFLAALSAGAAELIAASSAEWRSSIAREITVQIRPVPGRAVEPALERAVALAQATPGIASARAFSKAESERLLEPWLGSGLDLGELPVPRLIVVKLAEGARPDLDGLRARLAEAVPGATLDDHGLWLSRLSAMATAIVGLGVAVVVLVLVATGLAVAFATRGAMAGNREVVEVLHFVGAGDDFIAREFQRRFFALGLRGGLVGGGAALALIAALGFLARAWRTGPGGDEIQALFGALSIGWRGYASVALIGAIASLVTAIVSRVTVRRFLVGGE